jgi:hypothetical protein
MDFAADVRAKTLKDLDFLQDAFDIKLEDGHPRLIGSPPPGAVGATIAFMSEHWLEADSLMDSTRLQAVFRGRTLLWEGPNPTRIMNGIEKASLYADLMLIPDPIASYACMTGAGGMDADDWRKVAYGDHRPSQDNEYWLPHFTRSALTLCSLRPWIESGAIALLLPPSLWHPQMAREMVEVAKKAQTRAAWRSTDKFVRSDPVNTVMDILLDQSEGARAAILDHLDTLFPWLDPRLLPQIKNTATNLPPEPSWLALPNVDWVENMVSYGAGLLPHELRHVLDYWNVFGSTTRSSAWVRHHMQELYGKGVYVDSAGSSNPIVLPQGLPIELIFAIREDGILSGLRTTFRAEVDAFQSAGVDGTEAETRDRLALLVERVNAAIHESAAEFTTLKKRIAKEVIFDVGGATVALAGLLTGHIVFLTMVGVVAAAASVTGDVATEAKDLPKSIQVAKRPLFATYRTY